MAAPLTITSDTVVKVIVRKGLDADRRNIILSSGELGYSIDTNRLFIGDGFTIGGWPVGNICYGATFGKYNYTSIAQTGDLIFDTADYTLYTFNGPTSGWINVHPHFDNLSIIRIGNTWAVNPLVLSGIALSAVEAVTTVQTYSAEWIYGYNNLAFMAGQSVKANFKSTLGTNGSGSDLIVGGPYPQFVGNTGSSSLTAITLSAGNGIQYLSAGVRLTIGLNGTYNGDYTITGNLSANGDIIAYATSDSRLKDNVKPITSALEKIDRISGVEYDWNTSLQSTYTGHDIGVLAQEIEEILPEAVITRSDGYKAVKYEKLVPLLIQAIKELKVTVNKK
jgi:hypothetical protein